MFEQVKNEILAVGFEEILCIPRARDARTDLAISLLNDAGTPAPRGTTIDAKHVLSGTNAYWSTGEGFVDVIGLTVLFSTFCASR